MSVARAISVGLILVLSSAGCSGIRTYPNTAEHNAIVHVRNDSDMLLSSTRVDVDLYTVDAACRVTYLGTLALADPSVDLGLPLDAKVYLAFVFSRSAILGTSGTTAIEMMVAP